MTLITIQDIQAAISHLRDDPTLAECMLIQAAIFQHALQADSLSELFEILTLQSDLFFSISSEYRHELGVQSGAWITDLPAFSDSEPTSTEGVWSWDDTHLLTGEGWAEWEIVERGA